jgi:putative transposase
MPRKPRAVEAGLTYHITQRGVDRNNVFFSHGDRLTYLALASSNVADCEIRIFAWCLMTNHVHLVIEAGRRDALAVFFRRVNGRYAQYLNARRGRTGHLWQNRFYSCPVGPTHLWRALTYVEANPVRAGIVEEADAYPWSSAKAHLAGPNAETGHLLDWNFWQDAGGVEGWREKVLPNQDIRQIAQIRQCTHAGKPYGEEEFLKTMEKRFGRQWNLVGRPPTQIPKREMGTELSASLHEPQMGAGSG